MRAGGFTLIELLFVVIILSLVGAFAVPQLSLITETRLRSTTKSIGELVRYTYSNSAFKRQMYRLRFDIDKGEIIPEYLEETKAKSSKEEEPKKEVKEQKFKNPIDVDGEFVPDKEMKKFVLPNGVKIFGIYSHHSGEIVKEGEDFILFLPNGFVERGIIYIEDKYERIFSIFINQLTGGIEVKPELSVPEELI